MYVSIFPTNITTFAHEYIVYKLLPAQLSEAVTTDNESMLSNCRENSNCNCNYEVLLACIYIYINNAHN